MSMPTKEDLFEKGMNAMADGKLDASIEDFKAAVALDAGYADALQALTMLYYQTQRYDEAIETGKRLVAANPDDILSHTSLSMFYVAKGMVPEAEAESAEARRLTWKNQLKGGK